MKNNVNVNDSSSKGLLDELLEGRNLTRELQLVLSNEPHSSSKEAYGLMARNILAKFERSLQILHYDPMNQFQFHQRAIIATADSPNSFSGSPKSLDSDGDFKDLADHKDESKKRRISPRVIQRVQGSTSSGLEGPIEDGYSWRKYGQKDILGANFPRSYYRCTYRVFQGCLATKQVQRNDDDPSSFDVTYRGKHTCSQASSSSSSIPNNLVPKLEPVETLTYLPHHPQPQQPQEIIWDFQRDNVKDIKPIITTNNSNVNHVKSSSFSFPSSSNSLPNNSDNFVVRGNFPTNTNIYTYQSPPSPMNKNSYDHNNQTSAIDHPQGALLQEVVQQSSTSATNSPAIASELSFDHQGEYHDDDFILDNNPNFFQ